MKKAMLGTPGWIASCRFQGRKAKKMAKMQAKKMSMGMIYR
jgi:hypothetical protein